MFKLVSYTYLDTAIDFVREDSIVAIDRIEDLSSSAIASRYRNVFDMITPPCTEITYMPNRRLKALMSEYGNLTETDEHVLKSELNMRVSCEMQQSWQSPSGGSETNVNDPLLAVFFRQITNLLTDIEQLVIDANRPTNMKLVLANQISQPERVLIYRGNILIGSEAKGADVSDFRTLMQCLQICADACLNLYQQGLESDDCVVPGVITFGESVRMVAVYFLPESYPVIVYLSQSLQICSSTDRMNLARWAVALASFARETLLLLQSAKPRVTEIMYQLKIALFFKPVRNIEKLGGSQVLRPQNNKDVSSARINLDSMMHVYSLLSAVANAQQCILFPLGVITFPLSSFQTDQGTRTSQAPALRNLVLSTVKKYFDLQPADYEHVPIVVFPLMVGSSNEGWRNSRPSRGFVNAYLSRLAEAVRVLNEARVAHMDLR